MRGAVCRTRRTNHEIEKGPDMSLFSGLARCDCVKDRSLVEILLAVLCCCCYVGALIFAFRSSSCQIHPGPTITVSKLTSSWHASLLPSSL